MVSPDLTKPDKWRLPGYYLRFLRKPISEFSLLAFNHNIDGPLAHLQY